MGKKIDTVRNNLHSQIWERGRRNLSHGWVCRQSHGLMKDLYKLLMIATSGGLNHQQTGITDVVVAACILNATLVVGLMSRSHCGIRKLAIELMG